MKRVYVKDLKIYDAVSGSLIAEGFERLEQVAKYCYDNQLELPLHSHFGTFLKDREGRFLYKGTHPGDMETARGDIIEGLEICPVCGGLAEPADEAGCMVCILCNHEFHCIPPDEEIGSLD